MVALGKRLHLILVCGTQRQDRNHRGGWNDFVYVFTGKNFVRVIKKINEHEQIYDFLVTIIITIY